MKQSWEIKKMFDVVDFQRGLTYSKNDEVDFSENIVLRSNNVDLKTNKLDFTELRYINPKIVIPENKKVAKGSLLICTANGSKSHLGKVALIDDDYNYAFGGFMGLIKPKKNLNSVFLFYLMTSDAYKKFIGTLSDGANINNLKFGDLGNLEIPVPPLSEQQSIVSILDEAFAAIAKSKANAEQNIKNAKELFESYLQNIFRNKNKNWEEKRFEDCLDKITYTNKIQKQDFLKDGKYPIISQEQDFINGYWNNSNDLFQVKRPVVIFGDHTQILKFIDFNFVLGADGVKILQPTKEIDTKYFYYYLRSAKLRTLGYARHYKLLKEIMVSYPKSIQEQKSIVKKLDDLSKEAKKLEDIYKNKRTELEELKKSILQKAFSGEL